MAETPKTPKDLKIRSVRRVSGDDDYEHYMQAVLRQAATHPEVTTAKRTN